MPYARGQKVARLMADEVSDFFKITYYLQPLYDTGIDPFSNRNEYQETF
jgi:hypothetical protein